MRKIAPVGRIGGRGDRDRPGDDFALGEQALHLGLDQSGAELVEIERAADENREAEQVEDDDELGQALEGVERLEAAHEGAPSPGQPA
jgi:hypothetical protein